MAVQSQIFDPILSYLIHNKDYLNEDLTFGSPFHLKSPFSLSKYIQRIIKWTNSSYEVIILAQIYIKRLQIMNPFFIINQDCIHRLILTSYVIAVKFHEDQFHSNSYYARVGGITLDELNRMEKEFLQMIEYDLYVKNSDFTKFISNQDT